LLQLNLEGKRVRKSFYINEVIPEAEDQSLFDMTQEEVAQVLNVKREGISQVEKRAMKKVKAILKEKGLTFEDFIGENK
jgi:DNA-directed RNA polymerase sigma subunit (sigma70/sigma32)